MKNRSRREILATAAGGMACLAGCNELSSTDTTRDHDPGSPTHTATPDTPTRTNTETATPTVTPGNVRPTIRGWSVPNANASRSRWVPSATVPPTPPTEAWNLTYEEPEPPDDTYGSYAPTIRGPVVHDDLLLMSRRAVPSAESEVEAPEQYLEVYDTDTHEVLWSKRAVISNVALVGDVAVGWGPADEINVFDRETGEKRWEHTTEYGLRGVLPGESYIHAVTWRGIRSFTHDGELRWQTRPLDSSFRTGLSGFGDELYVGSSVGVAALSAETGDLLWHATDDAAPKPDLGIRVVGSTLLKVSSSNVVALDTEAAGELLWQRTMGGEVISMAMTDNLWVAVTESGKFGAYDLANGDRLWELKLDRKGRRVSIADSSILVGTEATLQLFDRYGVERWRLSRSDLPVSPNNIIVSDEQIYLVGFVDSDVRRSAVMSVLQ